MIRYGTDTLDSFERWSETTFVTAGSVWLVDSVLYVLDLYGGVSIPGAVNGTLILTAFFLTLAGLLGFYPHLAEENPRLAISGVVLVALVGIVVLVTFVWVAAAGLLETPMPPGSTLALIVIGSLLALVLYGVASVRTDSSARMSGLLLLTLAAAMGVWVLTGLLVATPEWTAIVFGVVFSVSTASIGYTRHVAFASLSQKARSRAPASR